MSVQFLTYKDAIKYVKSIPIVNKEQYWGNSVIFVDGDSGVPTRLVHQKCLDGSRYIVAAYELPGFVAVVDGWDESLGDVYDLNTRAHRLFDELYRMFFFPPTYMIPAEIAARVIELQTELFEDYNIVTTAQGLKSY